MLGKILGAGIGWGLMGPLGAILGYFVASSFDGRSSSFSGTRRQTIYDRQAADPNPAGSIAGALVVLFAAVARADRKIHAKEVQFIQKYFTEKFGTQNAADMMALFNHSVKQSFDHVAVAYQVKQHSDYYSRLQLLQMLYGLAQADGQIDADENRVIGDIAEALGIKARDHESLRAIYSQEDTGPYKVLGIKPEATNDEIKSAYRSLVRKYHPDKVSHLGEEFVNIAQEKFKAVKGAYDRVKKERGF